MKRDIAFNIDLAQRYVVDGAILLHHISYWCFKNKAEARNLRDGRHWTYNSVAATSTLFPFWTSDQVRRRMDKLVQQGALLKGNYNEAGYDRTSWWSLTDELWDFYSGLPTAFGKSANSKRQSRQKDLAPVQEQYQVTTQMTTKTSTQRMARPTIEELTAEFRQLGIVDAGELAEKFTNYYESNGWKVGRNPMKSWKHTAKNWARNESKNTKQNRGFNTANFSPTGISDFIANG